MQWTDEAVILSSRPQGESGLILSLLTRAHGRHLGLARGAAKGRQRGLYEPGTRVIATWGARLSEHLGQLRTESIGGIAGFILDDPLRLACLEAAAALADAALPEREPHGAVFQALESLLGSLVDGNGYGAAHLSYELTILAETGYGLDLSRCAVTGQTTDLAYVSPRTGRAVCRAAAEPYADRLLVLPRVLGGVGRHTAEVDDLLDGLALTGAFLEPHLRPALPAARARYLDRLRKAGRDGARLLPGPGTSLAPARED